MASRNTVSAFTGECFFLWLLAARYHIMSEAWLATNYSAVSFILLEGWKITHMQIIEISTKIAKTFTTVLPDTRIASHTDVFMERGCPADTHCTIVFWCSPIVHLLAPLHEQYKLSDDANKEPSAWSPTLTHTVVFVSHEYIDTCCVSLLNVFHVRCYKLQTFRNNATRI